MRFKAALLPWVLACACMFQTPVRAHAPAKSQAESLWEDAQKAVEAKRFAEAVRLFERSMALCPPQELDCQSANCNGLARAYEGLGDDVKARQYYEKSLALNRRRRHDPDLAIDLLSLGSLLHVSFEQHAQALPLLEEALDIYRRLGQKPDIALALCQIGGVRNALGRPAEAIPALEESLALNRSLRDDEGIASVLAHLGDACNRVGNYEKAGTCYEEALSGLRRQNRLSEVASVSSRKGLNDLDRHRPDLALAGFEEALRLGLKLDDRVQAANALINLGALHFDQGQYDKAQACYQQALTLARALGRKSLLATAGNNLGHVQAAMGHYDQAIEQYQAALALNRDLGRGGEVAINQNNIAMAYQAMHRFEEALAIHRQVLAQRRKAGDAAGVAQTLSNMGACCMFNRQYALAELSFLERQAMQKDLRGVKLRNPGLAELYLLTGRPRQAMTLLEAEPPGSFAEDPVVAEYLMQLGRAQAGLGQLAQASGNLLKACAILEEIRSAARDRGGFLAAGSGGGRFRTYRALASVLAERALKGEPMDPAFRPYGDSLAAAAFYFSEATKARSLTEQLVESGRTAAMGAMLPTALRREEEQLRARREALEAGRDQAAKAGSAAFARHREQRAALARELDGFVARLRKEQPVYAAVHYPRPVAARELPLANGELMLAYALGEEASYLFAVRRGGVEKVLRIPGPRAQLEERVKTFLAPLNGRKPDSFSAGQGQDLFRLLLEPGLALARPEDRIVVVPDGILGTLPFEILVTRAGQTPADSAYVGAERTFSYYQSAALLALKRTLPRVQASRPLFALGNPDFSSGAAPGAGPAFRGLAVRPVPGGTPMVLPAAASASPLVEFPPLPETEAEVRAIAALQGVPVRPPDVLLGRDASEAAVAKAPLGSYRILHWATHAALAGLVQDVNEPFLLLSQRDKTPDHDGFLTLSEVLDLRLNADLVVLSACVTGLGREVEGEGVANFARAFQSAGAKRVVVSLWEVASDPAVDFATFLYTALKGGKGYAEAFRTAQDSMRRKYPNPYYWGVFILHGEA